MPHPKDNLSSQLDYEGWRDLLRSMCGRYYSEGIEPNSFSGWVRAVSVRGFTALDIGSNAQRVERTYQDVRRDSADHYFTLFPANGQLAMTHNDQTVRLAVGDVALVDAARPVTYSAEKRPMEHRFAELAASIAGFLSRIRTAGRPLQTQRNARRTPALRAYSDLREC